MADNKQDGRLWRDLPDDVVGRIALHHRMALRKRMAERRLTATRKHKAHRELAKLFDFANGELHRVLQLLERPKGIRVSAHEFH